MTRHDMMNMKTADMCILKWTDIVQLLGHEIGGAPSVSFSCIFLLAARIISSLRRFSIFCLSSLLLAQPVAGASSSFSFPFELIRDCRLYLVIKSGSILTGCAPEDDVVDEVVVNVIGG